MLGAALGEERIDEGAQTARGIGFLVAGGRFLASLVGSIVLLASTRSPQAGGRGRKVALGAIAFMATLWLGPFLIFGTWTLQTETTRRSAASC